MISFLLSYYSKGNSKLKHPLATVSYLSQKTFFSAFFINLLFVEMQEGPGSIGTLILISEQHISIKKYIIQFGENKVG